MLEEVHYELPFHISYNHNEGEISSVIPVKGLNIALDDWKFYRSYKHFAMAGLRDRAMCVTCYV